MTQPQFSVVIPAHDEAQNLPALLGDLRALVEAQAGEVIVVNDGSGDDTARVLDRLCAGWPWLRVLTHPRPFGQSAALRSGIRAARAEIVATLDGDGQNPPQNLGEMIAAFRAAPPEVGMIQGVRVKRRDSASKRLASRFANGIRGALLRDGCPDSGCALRVFWRQAYLDLPWFRHLHRFMPALIRRDGWQVQSMPVTHAPRTGGRSHYSNWQRGLAGIPDLVGVSWLIWRSPRGLVAGPWWADQANRPATTAQTRAAEEAR